MAAMAVEVPALIGMVVAVDLHNLHSLQCCQVAEDRPWVDRLSIVVVAAARLLPV